MRELLVDSRFGGMRTNVVTNPSMETASTAVVVRTNFCTNPNFETDIATWTSAASATLTRTTAEFFLGTASLQVACPGAVINEGTATSNYPGMLASTVYTASAYVKGPAGVALKLVLRSVGAGNTDTTTNFTTTGAWQRVTVTSTSRADATSASLQVRTQANPGPVTFFVDAVLIELAATAKPYFDGSVQQTPDSDLTSAWNGTANASASNLNGPSVAGHSNAFPERAGRVQSGQWASNGTKSVRIIPLSNNSYAEIPLTGLIVGATYTVTYLRRTTEVLTGTPNAAYAGRFGIYSPSATNEFMLVTPPNTPGVHKVQGWFTAASVTHSIRLGHGYSSGDAWFDALLIERTDARDKPYFDGSTRNAKWTGTANASTSIGFGFAGVV